MGTTPEWWTQSKSDIDKLDIGDTIVLKVPGSNVWAGRGMTPRYSGTAFYVMKIMRFRTINDQKYFDCDLITEIPLRKK